MNLPSNEEKAWIQFLLVSDNSIIRDAGGTLLALNEDLLIVEAPCIPLEQKSTKEWEQALLIANCMKLSSNDNLVELSRIIYEWFSGAFDIELVKVAEAQAAAANSK
jgi:hypothetical protein